MAAKAAPLFLRRVAGAHADLRFVDRYTLLSSHVGNSCQGRTQIALHVNCKRFERADVDDATALRFIAASKHEPIETPQEARQCFPSSRRSKNQSALTPRDGRPAETLRRGGSVEHGAKPLRCNRMEELQNITGVRISLHALLCPPLLHQIASASRILLQIEMRISASMQSNAQCDSILACNSRHYRRQSGATDWAARTARSIRE